jgi:hypothetical protein
MRTEFGTDLMEAVCEGVEAAGKFLPQERIDLLKQVAD